MGGAHVPDSAAQSSNLDENQGDRRSSMQRSRMWWSWAELEREGRPTPSCARTNPAIDGPPGSTFLGDLKEILLRVAPQQTRPRRRSRSTPGCPVESTSPSRGRRRSPCCGCSTCGSYGSRRCWGCRRLSRCSARGRAQGRVCGAQPTPPASWGQSAPVPQLRPDSGHPPGEPFCSPGAKFDDNQCNSRRCCAKSPSFAFWAAVGGGLCGLARRWSDDGHKRH